MCCNIYQADKDCIYTCHLSHFTFNYHPENVRKDKNHQISSFEIRNSLISWHLAVYITSYNRHSCSMLFYLRLPSQKVTYYNYPQCLETWSYITETYDMTGQNLSAFKMVNNSIHLLILVHIYGVNRFTGFLRLAQRGSTYYTECRYANYVVISILDQARVFILIIHGKIPQLLQRVC